MSVNWIWSPSYPVKDDPFGLPLSPDASPVGVYQISS